MNRSANARLLAIVTAFVSLLLPAPALCADSPTPAAHDDISLVRVTPQGAEVQPPDQIVFQFNRPVVPVGRMERSKSEIAISFSPPINCDWRWTNTSALTCSINQGDTPKQATEYTITVPANFDTTRGTTLRQETKATFATIRPNISGVWFSTWTAPGRPVISLSTNQRVSQESLSKHLFIEDAQKLRHEVDVTPWRNEEPQDGEAPDEPSPEQRGLRWNVSPRNDLPLNARFSLKLSAGLTPLEGSLAGLENAAVTSFSTFPAFSFLGVDCTDLKGNPVRFDALKDAAAKGKCNPLGSIYLAFSAPVLKENLKDAITSTPDLKGGRTDFDPWEYVYSYSQLSQPHQPGARYVMALPYGLKANSQYSLSAAAGSITDQFGRTLDKDLSIRFATDHRAARFVMDNQVSVLEKNTDSKLPLVVNNLDKISVSYQAVTSSSNQSRLSTTLTPYKVEDVAYPFPLDVRELLGGRSGVVQGTITTTPRTEGPTWFFSQVTPYEVHLKLGHFNSLAWVTSLSSGEPVQGAKVSVTSDVLTALSSNPKVLASASTDSQGIAMLPGTSTLDPKLEGMYQWQNNKPRLVVRVEKDGDLAFVPVSWDYQVYAGDVYPSQASAYGHMHAWGTTAQGLYKAGDSVQFALWVRDQNEMKFISPRRDGYKLEVTDPTGKVVYTVPEVTLSEFGSFSGQFTTKSDAAVGWYTFTLSSTFSNERWQPLRVLISDFTPAPFKVTAEIRGQQFRQGDALTVSTEARLHAGGPYSDADLRVTSRIKSAQLTAADPALDSFYFQSSDVEGADIAQSEEKLDASGNNSSTVTIPESEISYGTIIVESAVKDDRGKYVANAAKAKFFGRDRFAGVAQPDWLLTAGKAAIANGIVVGENGKPAVGVPFTLEAAYQETKAARVKSAGNVYVTKYERQWISIATCQVTSQATPVSCAFTPTKPGEYRITAKVLDTKGREHASNISRWATGRGEIVWETGANNEMKIIPEKKSYTIGETARFLIQNPFIGAQALLTTERYGVQRSWVKTLTENTVLVEVPVTREHLPGFFFSATVVSPRVEKPIENQVDLGKPAFKMGYASVTVSDPNKGLSVTVKPQRDTYKPKETVTVDIAAQQKSAAPLEYAVTVLDEAVFDLIQQGRDYFDPHKGFYTLDGLDMQNYNLIKMLIGRQKFEKKGANAGGDGGGNLDMRSLKKFVSYWNPSIRPDESGKATISFEAPDNLTGWKVFVVAMNRDDLMGLGEGSFTVNKQTEVRAALPNQVREGDTFTATFTVMNRSDKARTLNITASTEGPAVSAVPRSYTVQAEPFKRYPVEVSAKAVAPGEARLIVKASDTNDADAVLGTLQVLSRAALQTAATFGSSEAKTVKEPIAFPADMRPDVGTVGVVLAPSVIGAVEGAFTYMKEYPYSCWEQKLSKGVMAAHAIALRQHLPKGFEWKNATSTVTEMLKELSSHQAPNGGMTFYAPQEDYVSQYLSAYTALALGWLADGGYAVPKDEESKLHEYLSSMLKNEVFPTFFSPGLKSSVRAVALAALARRGKATASDLQRYKTAVREMNLFGKAMYLDAAVSLNAAPQLINEVTNQILVAGNETGATYTFTEPVEATSERILDSNMRTQCAVASALLRAHESPAAGVREKIASITPKLIRSITLERKRKDRWENTQENLFCMNAVATYSAIFEKSQPKLDLSVRVGGEQLATVSLKNINSEPLEVSRPIKASDVGTFKDLEVVPSGTGRFYYSTRLTYSTAQLKQSATNAGIEISREYSVKRNGQWFILKNPVTIPQGELVKVDLFVKLAAPRNYVVVEDPIPGGFEAVNRDLATSSGVDAEQGAFVGAQNSLWFDAREWIDFGSTFWSFYHKELRHSAARFYSEYLPAGNYHLSYVSQAIAAGEFVMLPAHAETMYDPDVFGDSSSDTLRVTAAR
jgi:uncharacterized protein YfaS (alpha-2-macroglobulin family)